MSTIPKHLRDEACYVCGALPENHGTQHPLFSNAEALRQALGHDARATYSYNKEAAYVAEHRPY